jgi:hypothetical protein
MHIGPIGNVILLSLWAYVLGRYPKDWRSYLVVAWAVVQLLTLPRLVRGLAELGFYVAMASFWVPWIRDLIAKHRTKSPDAQSFSWQDAWNAHRNQVES